MVDFLHDDLFKKFSWVVLACIAAAYTLLAIGSELVDGWKVRNSREEGISGLQAIARVHVGFLVTLSSLFWTARFLYHFAPEWMTDPFVFRGRSTSVLEGMFVLSLIGLGFVERQWLQINSESRRFDRRAGGPDPNNRAGGPGAGGGK